MRNVWLSKKQHSADNREARMDTPYRGEGEIYSPFQIFYILLYT